MLDFTVLKHMFMALLILEVVHLYQDYSYAKEQVARGCVKMGERDKITEVTPGVTVEGVVWFCGHPKEVRREQPVDSAR